MAAATTNQPGASAPIAKEAAAHWIGPKILWPALVIGTSAGFFAGFSFDFAEPTLALVPAVAIGVLFLLEFWLPDRPGRQAGHDPQLWNDLGHSLLGQGLGNTAGQLVFVVGAATAASAISARWGGNIWPVDWPLWVQVPLAIALLDGLDYGRHRLQHNVQWLWPIHALHHDVDRMNVMKSGRGHALDMLFRNLVVYAPLALLGAPSVVMYAYAAAVTVFGPVAHANVSLPVPRALHRLIMTPQVHRIHHAKPLDLSCSNYANVFPFWDILFGSYEHPDAHPSFEYGVESGAQPQSFLGQITEPFTFWRRAARRCNL